MKIKSFYIQGRLDVRLILIIMLTFGGLSVAQVYAYTSPRSSTVHDSPHSGLSSLAPSAPWLHVPHLREDSSMDYLAQSSSEGRRASSATSSRKSNVANTSSRSPRSAARSEQRSRQGRAILRSEKTFKMGGSGKSTVIDFDETDITGERRDPGVGFVQSTFAERKSNFVKIRREWHDAMIKSTQFVD